MSHNNQMTPMSKRSRKILLEIDENGVGLTKSEIDFVASLIDGEEPLLTEKGRCKLGKIYKKRVAGAEDSDE